MNMDIEIESFEPFSIGFNDNASAIKINGKTVPLDSSRILALVQTFAVTMGIDLGAKVGDTVEVSFSYQVGAVS